MCSHNHRVLVENRITPAEWAFLSATSYFLPILPVHLLTQAQLISEDQFCLEDIKEAGRSCATRGWILAGEHGISLSDEGRHIYERVEQELMETVELL